MHRTQRFPSAFSVVAQQQGQGRPANISAIFLTSRTSFSKPAATTTAKGFRTTTNKSLASLLQSPPPAAAAPTTKAATSSSEVTVTATTTRPRRRANLARNRHFPYLSHPSSFSSSSCPVTTPPATILHRYTPSCVSYTSYPSSSTRLLTSSCAWSAASKISSGTTSSNTNTSATTSSTTIAASTPSSTSPRGPSTPVAVPTHGTNHSSVLRTAAHHHYPPFGSPAVSGGQTHGYSTSSVPPATPPTMPAGSTPACAATVAAAAAEPAVDSTTAVRATGTSQADAIPALPAPGGEQEAGGKQIQTLEVDGKTVALDHLGPIVVGKDGTISRIANWGEMAEIERQNTLRILGKRNQLRLAALREEKNAD